MSDEPFDGCDLLQVKLSRPEVRHWSFCLRVYVNQCTFEIDIQNFESPVLPTRIDVYGIHFVMSLCDARNLRQLFRYFKSTALNRRRSNILRTRWYLCFVE